MRGDTVQNIHTRDVCRMHYADERSKCRRTKNPSHPTHHHNNNNVQNNSYFYYNFKTIMIPSASCLQRICYQQQKYTKRSLKVLNKIPGRKRNLAVQRRGIQNDCQNESQMMFSTNNMAAAAATAFLTLSIMSSTNNDNSSILASRNECQCETIKERHTSTIDNSQSNQPRNVMVHRLRSLRGRSLNEKYNVDWKNVLGEGAYGSVHPARLAATGEKVRVY